MDGFRSNLSEKYGHKSHETDGVTAPLIPMICMLRNIIKLPSSKVSNPQSNNFRLFVEIVCT